MKSFRTIPAAIVALLLLSTQARAEDLNVVGANKISDPRARAEALAHIGEKLTSPVSFMYANDVFKMAAKADPQNQRVQFYLHALAPQIALRGSLKKISYLAPKFGPQMKENYRQMVRLSRLNASVHHFLFDSQTVYGNELQAQSGIDQVIAAIDANRTFLKSLDRGSFTIRYMDPSNSPLERILHRCWVVPTPTGYRTNDCPELTQTSAKADGADFEALAQINGGLEMLITIPNAYNLTGTIDLANKKNIQTQRDFFTAVASEASLGQARNTASLATVLSMGSDMLSAAKWAYKWKSRLCPDGNVNAGNRPGQIFYAGICVPSRSNGVRISRVFAVLETGLSGGTWTVVNNQGQTNVKGFGPEPTPVSASIQIQPSRFFSQPIQDLHSILPNAYDACGQAVGLSDPSVGGIVVNGDAPAFLRSLQSECR